MDIGAQSYAARGVGRPGGGAAARRAARCARLPGVINRSRRTRFAAALCAALTLLLVAAPAALAENGVGLAGPVTDKTITFFCFGVMAFFTVLVVGLSLIQGSLEKRKERRKADLKKYS